jgi:hypothetical protein
MTPEQAPVTLYCKKPVVIEARQLNDAADWSDIALWCGGTLQNTTHGVPGAEPETYLYIQTLEGRMEATINDWIIKGVKGEFYPCKPDIFEMTYEPAALRPSESREADDPLEPLEKLAAKWADHKPYRDDEYWEGVRACAGELRKVLSVLRAAGAGRQEPNLLTRIMDFLDESTPEDADTSHWAARAYQEIGAKFNTAVPAAHEEVREKLKVGDEVWVKATVEQYVEDRSLGIQVKIITGGHYKPAIWLDRAAIITDGQQEPSREGLEVTPVNSDVALAHSSFKGLGIQVSHGAQAGAVPPSWAKPKWDTFILPEALPDEWYERAKTGLARKKISTKTARQLRICAEELRAALTAAPAEDKK